MAGVVFESASQRSMSRSTLIPMELVEVADIETNAQNSQRHPDSLPDRPERR